MADQTITIPTKTYELTQGDVEIILQMADNSLKMGGMQNLAPVQRILSIFANNEVKQTDLKQPDSKKPDTKQNE